MKLGIIIVLISAVLLLGCTINDISDSDIPSAVLAKYESFNRNSDPQVWLCQKDNLTIYEAESGHKSRDYYYDAKGELLYFRQPNVLEPTSGGVKPNLADVTCRTIRSRS